MPSELHRELLALLQEAEHVQERGVEVSFSQVQGALHSMLEADIKRSKMSVEVALALAS